MGNWLLKAVDPEFPPRELWEERGVFVSPARLLVRQEEKHSPFALDRVNVL